MSVYTEYVYTNQNRKNLSIYNMYTHFLSFSLFSSLLLQHLPLQIPENYYQRCWYTHSCVQVQLNNIKLFLNTCITLLNDKRNAEGLSKQSINTMFSLLSFNDSPQILHLHHLNQRCLLSIHWKTNNPNILVRFFSNSRNVILFCLHMV